MLIYLAVHGQLFRSWNAHGVLKDLLGEELNKQSTTNCETAF